MLAGVPGASAVLGMLIGPSNESEADDSPLLADNVDPHTRDFADLFVGMDPVDSQVLVALTTIRGSGAAVVEDGVTEPPRKMTASLANELESDAKNALRRLVGGGDVEVVSVKLEEVSETNQYAQRRVQYRNLRSGKLVSSSVPLSPTGTV